MSTRKILVFGSIAYDNIMGFSGDINNNLESNKEKKVFNLALMPNSKILSYGGTSGNIGYNLGNLQSNTEIITAVGKDFKDLGYEQRVKSWKTVEFKGVVHPTLFTASCYIVNDENNNQLIIFHGGAMDKCPEIDLVKEGILKDSYYIASVSPDNPVAMIQWAKQLNEIGIPFVFDPGQVTPAFSADNFQEVIPLAEILIGNEFEIKQILTKMKISIEELVLKAKNVIMTKGKDGSILYSEGKVHQIPICKPSKIIDTTGAGDGYRSGLLGAIAKGKDLYEACQVGSVVGSFVVETAGPQTQEFSINDLKSRFEGTFGKELMWD